MAYLTSHLYFMAFLTLVSIVPPDPSTRTGSMFPYWYEMVVWTWYLGLLLAQVTNPGAKGGLSWVKYLLVALGLLSIVGHSVAFFVDSQVKFIHVYVFCSNLYQYQCKL